MSTSILDTLERQIALLGEEEQQKVIAYVDSLLQEQRLLREDDIVRLQEFIGIGNGTIGDGSTEHDHYVYRTPINNFVYNRK